MSTESRVIALEEHFRSPMVHAAAPPHGAQYGPDTVMGKRIAKLDDVADKRLADMDAAGIDVQVLLHAVPAADALPESEAVALAREANNYLADAVGRHPDRFSGFATLSTSNPRAAAEELRRAVTELGFKGGLVNGLAHGRFLDDRFFWDMFEAAEQLEVPIYLHPAEPPAAMREAYYSGLSPQTAQMLATAGWGWHVDTGLHALRLILSGVFAQFPKLQIVLGHMGEALPFLLARSSPILTMAGGLPKSVLEYFTENFYFTTSGMFTYPPLQCLMLVLGSDRIMFAVDYPYSTNEQGRDFLLNLPISATDRGKIAHGTAERFLGL